MNNEEFEMYTFAEMRYELNNKGIDKKILFPPKWYNSKNYVLKTKIIAEAIDEKKLIKDTELYQKSFIERVK